MVQRKKRQVQNKKLNELECKSRKSPTEYWKLWKSLQVKKSQNNSKCIKMDDFFDQFQKQIYPPDIEYFDHNHINDINEKLSKCSYDLSINSIESDILNNEISKNEVILALKHLKAGKATGIDGIPIEFYKHASHISVTPLCSLFNYVLSKGEYPSGWSEGIISPIHKKGSTTDTSNYRKVTIMPSIGKILILF